jgi:glycosyltransferase involved in cell wall biosynthesis
MNKLLFLAPYPTPKNIKDGMISRVNAIDQFAEGMPRSYLEISSVRIRKKEVKQTGLVTVYRVNALLHFWLIARLVLNAEKIYSHSIHGFTFAWQWLPFTKADVILDVHGVVPEEIRFFSRYPFRYPYYAFIERVVFRKAKQVIFVTYAMKRHFLTKYRKLKSLLHVYSIYPHNLFKSNPVRVFDDERVNIIYSGGIAAWQNIDLMLQAIKANLSPRIKYTLLVSDKKYVLDKMSQLGIDPSVVEVDSVLPDQLAGYYSQADYAFVLRDDNVVNRVANPTKIVEYLSYGIIPIVLSPNIGDYNERGYEYLSLNDFNTEIHKPAGPSQKNKDIAKQLMEENAAFNLKSML